MRAPSPFPPLSTNFLPNFVERTHRLLYWLALVPWAICLGCSSAKPPPPLPPARAAATKTAAQAATLTQNDNWPAAAAQWSKAADRYRLVNDLPQLAIALHNLGLAQSHLDQDTAARASLERAAQLNKSSHRDTEWWRNQIALLQVDAAAAEEGSLKTRLAELQPQAEQLRDPELRGLFSNELGLWQTLHGDFDQAEESFRSAEDQFKVARDSLGVATVGANRAQLSEARKEWRTAVDQWRAALEAFEKLAHPPGITHALAGQGRSLLAAETDLPLAADLLERAAENYRSLGLRERLATLKLLEQALRAQGNAAAADAVATQLKQLSAGTGK